MTDPHYEAFLLDFGYYSAYVTWADANGEDVSEGGYFAFLESDASQEPGVRGLVDKCVEWGREHRPPDHPESIERMRG